MSMTIAARQQRLRENLERLPAKALEMRTLEDEIAEDENALALWASTQKSRAQRPVTPMPDPEPPAVDRVVPFVQPDDVVADAPLTLTESVTEFNGAYHG